MAEHSDSELEELPVTEEPKFHGLAVVNDGDTQDKKQPLHTAATLANPFHDLEAIDRPLPASFVRSWVSPYLDIYSRDYPYFCKKTIPILRKATSRITKRTIVQLLHGPDWRDRKVGALFAGLTKRYDVFPVIGNLLLQNDYMAGWTFVEVLLTHDAELSIPVFVTYLRHYLVHPEGGAGQRGVYAAFLLQTENDTRYSAVRKELGSLWTSYLLDRWYPESEDVQAEIDRGKSFSDVIRRMSNTADWSWLYQAARDQALADEDSQSRPFSEDTVWVEAVRLFPDNFRTTGGRTFPKVFHCPSCGTRLKADKPGRLTCSTCGAMFAIQSADVFINPNQIVIADALRKAGAVDGQGTKAETAGAQTAKADMHRETEGRSDPNTPNNKIVPGFDDEKDDSLKIRLQKFDGVDNCLALYLTGYVDIYNSNYYKKRVNKAIEAGYIKLILNYAGVNMIADADIDCNTSFLKAVKPRGGDLVILETQPQVYTEYQGIGLSQVFHFANALDEAVEFFARSADVPGGAAFPRTIKCPTCSFKLKTSKPGRFRCSNCKTILAIDNTGQVFLG